MATRITAFLVLLISLVFIFMRPSVGLYAWVLGVISFIIAWHIPWLGGIFMVLVGVFGLNLLPESNWDYWTRLPFYVFIAAFMVTAFLFIFVSILGWLLRIEWPLKTRCGD